MKDSLKPGVSRTRHVAVEIDRSVGFLGPGYEVYSTPSMVQDIEMLSHDLILEHLDDGEESVGIHISVDHLGATPIGLAVDITVTVAEIDRRRISLEAEVRDATEQVGRGRHDRFVVDIERQKTRLEEKAASAAKS
jgi:predicted thioesterase